MAPTGLSNPVVESGNRIVKASDTSVHTTYTFFVKVTADGGAQAYFGPYTLDMGCSTAIFADNVSFTNTGVSKLVGDSTSSVYTLLPPTASLSYCVITSNIVTESDGSSASSKVNNCGT